MIREYYPRKLQKEIDKLKEKFSKGVIGAGIKSDSIDKLINRIVACVNDIEIRLLSLSLTKGNLRAIAIYLKNNHLNVDLNKIIRVFTIVKDFHYFEVLYDTWQMNYTKPYEYGIIKSVIDTYRDDIEAKFEINDADDIAKWMSSEKASDLIAQKLINNGTPLNDIKSMLNKYCISENYSLYSSIEVRYLCNCNKNVYSELGDVGLYKKIYSLDLDTQRSILYNFLGVMDVKSLESFETIADHAYYKLFGEHTSRRYKDTIAIQPLNVKRAYDILINMFWILKLFGHDRRSLFWKKYIEDFTVRYYSAHDMLIMQFNRCVAIEFREVGPVYLFEKEIFEKKYRNDLLSTKTVELKRMFRHDEAYIEMKEHRGSWEWSLGSRIRKYAI